MSFSDALNKAKVKAAAETEEAREGDAPRAQTATATSQPHNPEEEEELHMPGSFDFGGQGGVLWVRRGPGAGTVDPFDAVGMLGNLWRRDDGADKDTPRFVFPAHLDLRFYLYLLLRLQAVASLRYCLGFLVSFFPPLLSPGSDCAVRMGRCSPCICCWHQRESYHKAT